MYDGSDNLVMRFDYVNDRMPVSMTYNGSTYYLTYDQIGSLRVVTNTSGTVVKRLKYDSFGNIINDTNPVFAVPLAFAGGLNDKDTGLVRFGARDYDPATGRWTAKDPIFFAGGDTDLYGYVMNDPVNGVDPEGLQRGGLPVPQPPPNLNPPNPFNPYNRAPGAADPSRYGLGCHEEIRQFCDNPCLTKPGSSAGCPTHSERVTVCTTPGGGTTVFRY